MPQTFIVNQGATFQAVALLAVEPKINFETKQQDKAKDGTPKWEVQVVAGFKDMFGKVNNEVIKVGVASHKHPAEGLGLYTPIELVDFTVGVIERTAKEDRSRVIGFQVWYRATEIRPLSATGPVNPRKSEG